MSDDEIDGVVEALEVLHAMADVLQRAVAQELHRLYDRKP